jgi:hypothetical protein
MHLAEGLLRTYAAKQMSEVEQCRAAAHLAACRRCASRLEDVQERIAFLTPLLDCGLIGIEWTENELAPAREKLERRMAQEAKPGRQVRHALQSLPSRWVWIALAAIVLLGALLGAVSLRRWLVTEKQPQKIEDRAPADTTRLIKPRELPRQSPPMEAPTYVPISRMRLDEYNAGTEYVMTGKVTSEKGEALPGTTVSVYSSSPVAPKYEWPAPIASDTCDGEGRYTIRLGSPMQYVPVVIEKVGFAIIRDSLLIHDPGTIIKNYELPLASVCVEGNVRDAEGRPISGARVSISEIRSNAANLVSMYSQAATTDGSGKFSIGRLKEGSLSVQVSARDFLDDKHAFVSNAGPCEQIDFRLKPAITISFVVKNRLGAVVFDPIGRYVTSAAPSGMLAMAKGTEPGALEWKAAPDEPPIQCIVSAKGYKTDSFALDPKTPPSEVVLETGETIKGRVQSESGRPVAGAVVNVIGTRPSIPGSALPVGFSEGVVETGSDGTFSMPLSNPPVYQITVTKAGYAEQRLVFGSKPAPSVIDVRLQPAEAGFFGRVIDEAGNPARRFTMYLKDLSAPDMLGFLRQFDTEDGRFSVTDVAPGVYSVRIIPDSVIPLTNADLPQLEIRKGFYYGGVTVQLSATRPTKK